jgi:hypothetical protein
MDHTFTEEYLRSLSNEVLLSKYATTAQEYLNSPDATGFDEHKAVRTEVLRRMRDGA